MNYDSIIESRCALAESCDPSLAVIASGIYLADVCSYTSPTLHFTTAAERIQGSGPCSFTVRNESGIGEYPNLSETWAKACSYTLDSILVPAGLRLRVWDGPNYTGTLVLDVYGPIIIYNSAAGGGFFWFQDYVLNSEFQNADIEALYPKAVRMLSGTVMSTGASTTDGWQSGSFKITCQSGVNTTTTTTTTTTSTTTTSTSTTTTCADQPLADVSPDIMSNSISYFAAGFSYPAGWYQVNYLYGALQYHIGGNFYLNESSVGGFRLVHSDGATTVEGPHVDYTGFPTQAGVEANNAGALVQFYHTGGKIGLYLNDSPYTDNRPGTESNPTFELQTVCNPSTTTTTTLA